MKRRCACCCVPRRCGSRRCRQPTSQAPAEAISRVVVGVVIDLLIGIVLSMVGIGIAWLSVRLMKYGAQLCQAVMGFVKAMVAIINTFMGHVDRYKKWLRGVSRRA